MHSFKSEEVRILFIRNDIEKLKRKFDDKLQELKEFEIPLSNQMHAFEHTWNEDKEYETLRKTLLEVIKSNNKWLILMKEKNEIVV